MFVDAHLHLNDFEDVDEVVKRAKAEGVKTLITSAYDLDSSQKNVEIANAYDGVFATVGIHPENLDGNLDLEAIMQLAKNKKVVAIGEIGLDYHFRTDNKELQKTMFVKQIELANELNLPIVVHSRDAMQDTYEILSAHKPKRLSLLHCYSGSLEMAKEFAKLGFLFSFGGVCTFKNAKNVVKVIEGLDVNLILTETDSPYMTPEPYRGTRNEPKYIPLIANKIAEIKNIENQKIEEIIYKNAKKVFNF